MVLIWGQEIHFLPGIKNVLDVPQYLSLPLSFAIHSKSPAEEIKAEQLFLVKLSDPPINYLSEDEFMCLVVNEPHCGN